MRGQGGEGSGGQEGNKGTEQVRGAACAHLHAPIYKWLFARVLHGAAVWHLVSWAKPRANTMHRLRTMRPPCPTPSCPMLPHCPSAPHTGLHHCITALLPPCPPPSRP